MVWFDPDWSRKRLTGHLLWFLGWLGVTVFALVLTPSPQGHGTHQQLGLPPCPSVLAFDRPCPGCGLTTSFTALLHGDLSAAWKANPFGPLFYLLWTASAFACLHGYWKGRRFNTDGPAASRTLMALVAVFFAFGIVRFFTTKYPLTWVERYVPSVTKKSEPPRGEAPIEPLRH
jgi:hypothetical protein